MKQILPTNWKTGIGFGVVAIVVAAVAYAGVVRDGSEAVAEEIGQAAQAEKLRIVDALADGGTFEIELATYSEHQEFPGDLIPEFMQVPHRIERIWMTVDDSGTIQESGATITDESGAVLATAIDTGTHRVFTAPDGETFEFPAATAKGQSLFAWIDGTFEQLTHMLQAGDGFTKTGTSTLAGMDSIVLEREQSGVPGGPDVRLEYEVAEEDPLIFRASTFERRDGEEVLVRETVVLSYDVAPTGNE